MPGRLRLRFSTVSLRPLPMQSGAMENPQGFSIHRMAAGRY